MKRISNLVAATAILLATVPPLASAEPFAPSIDDLLAASQLTNTEPVIPSIDDLLAASSLANAEPLTPSVHDVLAASSPASAELFMPGIDELLAASPLANVELAELSNYDLDEQRGGLRTPLGLDVGFGASVRTFVDGALVLESRLTWTEGGLRSEQIVNDLGSITGSPVRIGTLSNLATIAPGKATTVVHDLSMNRIANMVINTADNRTIRQETNVTLVLPQLVDIQQRLATDRLAAALQSSVGLALRDAATSR